MKQYIFIFLILSMSVSCLQKAKNDSEFKQGHLPHWDIITPDPLPESAVKINFTQFPSMTASADEISALTPIVAVVNEKDEVVSRYSDPVLIKTFADENCSVEIDNSSLDNMGLPIEGIASFPHFKIIKTEVRSLRAFSENIFSECVRGLSIIPGEAHSLAFSQFPAPLAVTAGEVFTTYPIITSFDQYGNIRSTDSTSVIDFIAYDDNNCGGNILANGLGGEQSKKLISGVTAFDDLTLNFVSVKSLQASMGSITICLPAFSVNPAAPSSTASSLVTNDNIVADNVDELLITLTILDQFENPISHYSPTISVSGSNNNVSACSVTDASGVSSCSITSTKAESKTITVTNTALAGLSGTVDFIAGEPSGPTSTISLSNGPANNTTPLTVTINIKDAHSNPVVGIVPDYEILNGRGTYTKMSACSATNELGVSTCTLRTFRAKEKGLRVTMPAALSSSVYGKGNLTCSHGSYFNSSEGNGSMETPYQVSTIEQLDQLRCMSTNFVVLMNDLDLAGIDWLTANYMTSIGFDGNNKTIYNMNVDIDLVEYQKTGISVGGLASFLGGSSGWSGAYRVIKDLTFINPIAIARGATSNAAIVAGKSVFKFENIHVFNGLVEASDWVGGLVLSLESVPNAGTLETPASELLNSSFEGTVKMIATTAEGHKYRHGVGGLVGGMLNGGANIKDNVFRGRIEIDDEVSAGSGFAVGGILASSGVSRLGINPEGELGVIANNLVEDSHIELRGAHAGGIIGLISKNFATTDIKVEKNKVHSVSFDYVPDANLFLGGVIGTLQPAANTLERDFTGQEIIIRENVIEDIAIQAASARFAKIGGLVGKGFSLIAEDNSVKGIHVTSIFNAGNRCIAGLMGTITDGISPTNNFQTVFKRNYAAMTVSSWHSSNTCVKGLVGGKSHQIFAVDLSSDDNYFDAELSGLAEISPYDDNGLSSHDMQNTVFDGWDAINTWLFSLGQYPSLR